MTETSSAHVRSRFAFADRLATVDPAAQTPVEQNICRWEGRAKFSHDRGDAFFQCVKGRVNRYLEQNGKSRFDDGNILFKGLMFGSLCAVFYALVLSNAFPAWALQLFAIGFGISALLLAINVAHDAAHHSLTPHRWLNNLLKTAIFTLLGANAYLWQLRHVKSHHVFPNVNGCDIDIDDNCFLRLSPNQSLRGYHRYQHVYAPFIFWLVDIHTVFYQDFVYLFKKRLANMMHIKHDAKEYVLFAGCKILYLCIVFFVPVIVMDRPWWHILIGALVMTFVVSATFVTLLIGTHFAEETEFPAVDANGRLPYSWAYHALATSLDWNPNSRVANFLVGGANAHAAHHLFPTVAHVHYVPISGIIQKAAREFAMPYHQTTFLGMVASHFRFLRKMGRPGLGPGPRCADCRIRVSPRLSAKRRRTSARAPDRA